MRSLKTAIKISILASAAMLMMFSPMNRVSNAASVTSSANFEYKFKVTNHTDTPIVKVLASPDGKNWGYFKLGGQIKPGQTVVLTWDSSTDESDCEWFFTAELENGEKTPAKAFDFCGEDVEIVISVD